MPISSLPAMLLPLLHWRHSDVIGRCASEAWQLFLSSTSRVSMVTNRACYFWEAASINDFRFCSISLQLFMTALMLLSVIVGQRGSEIPLISPPTQTFFTGCEYVKVKNQYTLFPAPVMYYSRVRRCIPDAVTYYFLNWDCMFNSAWPSIRG